jgi:hypothetical protein
MQAAIFHGPKDVTVGDRPDPAIQAPTDAAARSTADRVKPSASLSPGARSSLSPAPATPTRHCARC